MFPILHVFDHFHPYWLKRNKAFYESVRGSSGLSAENRVRTSASIMASGSESMTRPSQTRVRAKSTKNKLGFGPNMKTFLPLADYKVVAKGLGITFIPTPLKDFIEIRY
jgi:hypothetical protein